MSASSNASSTFPAPLVIKLGYQETTNTLSALEGNMENLLNFIIRCAEEKRFIIHFTSDGKSFYYLPKDFNEWVLHQRSAGLTYTWHQLFTNIQIIDPVDAAEQLQNLKEKAIKDTNDQIAVLEEHKLKILEPFESRLREIETYCKDRK